MVPIFFRNQETAWIMKKISTEHNKTIFQTVVQPLDTTEE
jgi:hypothetical protein